MSRELGRYLHRLLSGSLAILFALSITGTSVRAEPGEASPFDSGVQVADATLATMRGGFHNGKIVIPFGLDVKFTSIVDGAKTAGLTISNGNNPNNQVVVTEKNINVTVPVTQMNTSGFNVTTSLTSSGLLTVIQNGQSNVTHHTSQTLDVSITGLRNLIHSSFHGGRGFFH